VVSQLLLPGQKMVLITAAANRFRLMASTETGPVNWPTVASLHPMRLIA
jgi:hypothetical protein